MSAKTTKQHTSVRLDQCTQWVLLTTPTWLWKVNIRKPFLCSAVTVVTVFVWHESQLDRWLLLLFSELNHTDRDQQKSVKVEQSPAAASVQPGRAVTLQCSFLSQKKENRVQCPDEHSVFWFRAGSGGSHPNIIYPHRNSSCDRKDRSCVYSLSKTIQSSADNGTYYCAVVTCGEILFGEGTKVNTSKFLKALMLNYLCFKWIFCPKLTTQLHADGKSGEV